MTRCEPALDDLTLARARRGDERAVTALIRHHERLVFAVVGRMLVGRPAQVEDVAQEVFIKVVRHLPRFDPLGAAPLGHWIVTIATRTAIDALRRPLRAGDDTEPDELEAGAATLEEVAAGKQLSARLERAMAELPGDHRAVLVLRAFHDFDYPEIATALGIEEGTVKSRLSRARLALRRVMEETEGQRDA